MVKRGRKKGSKNKPKVIKETSLEIRRIKREIKDIRAKKRLLPRGDKVRIELGRELKVLRQLLKDKKELKTNIITKINTPEPEKEPIIAEILRIEKERNIKPTFEVLGIDLHKYNLEQLKKHLQKLNKKGGI